MADSDLARAEDNGVHFLDTSVCEVDRLPVYLNHPGLGVDTALGYQGQEMLALLMPHRRRNRQVLMRRILLRQGRKTRERELIQGDTSEQLV
jgi:hypothetical protein